MCANALPEGGWEGRIRYEWNALRSHFSDHLLCPLPPPRRPALIPLLSCSLFYIGHPFLFPDVSFFPSLSLSRSLSLSLSTFCSPKFGSHVHPPWFVFAYCKIVRLISSGVQEGSSIPELKFKGGAVRAVCFTRRESIIFYVRCAAQVRSIPFVLLPESP